MSLVVICLQIQVLLSALVLACFERVISLELTSSAKVSPSANLSERVVVTSDQNRRILESD